MSSILQLAKCCCCPACAIPDAYSQYDGLASAMSGSIWLSTNTPAVVFANGWSIKNLTAGGLVYMGGGGNVFSWSGVKNGAVSFNLYDANDNQVLYSAWRGSWALAFKCVCNKWYTQGAISANYYGDVYWYASWDMIEVPVLTWDVLGSPYYPYGTYKVNPRINFAPTSFVSSSPKFGEIITENIGSLLVSGSQESSYYG